MAIRQSDERFIVNTVVPALRAAEILSKRLDAVDSCRDQEKTESELTLLLQDALDEIALRIRRHGSSHWKFVQGRLVEIQERCPHDMRQPWTTTDNGVTFKVIKCVRCQAEVERTEVSIEEAG